jgi:RNAse (barnase) inhibitor barstar
MFKNRRKMSKLITDSKVLMDLITEDDNLQMTIDELKDAVLTCSELCVTIEFEDFNATRQRLAKVNMTLTNMLRTLAQVKNDFKDLNTTRQ